MKIYRFDRTVARPLHAFDSAEAYLARGFRTTAPAQIGCFYLEPGGRIGYHPATVPQLLLVVQGEGWVRAGDGERVPVAAGDAVFWEAGEWHETGTDTGLVALPIESTGLEPGAYMAERLS